jgi:hypothetical protein
VLPLALVLKEPNLFAPQLRLHALLPQVRKECRVIKGLLHSNAERFG